MATTPTTPPYSKLENESFNNPSEEAYGDPPPAYDDDPQKDNQVLPPGAYPPPPGTYPPQPTGSYPPPAGSYPMQQQPSYPMQQQPSYPMQQQPSYPIQQQPLPAPQVITTSPAVTNVIIGGGGLPPGTCTVCRKGKIKDSASCCTWFWCLLLFPLGIIPGLIAFCCCCRGPKCTHCGFTI